MRKHVKPNTGEVYSRFLRSLRVVGIALIDSRFFVDRQRYFEDEAERIFSDLVCDVSEVKGTHFELKAKMHLRSGHTKSQQGSLLLDATYLLHFHTQGKAVHDLVKKFAEGEARIVIWPYLREYVTSMCGRGHIPPITLPMAVNEPS
jgi:preprotein translocase subunit SecB